MKTNNTFPSLVCEEDLINSLAISDLCRRMKNRCVVLCDETTAKLYGNTLQQNLQKNGLEAYLFSFPAGEQFKTRQTKETIEDRMLAAGLGRDTTVLALGGGVVTDLGGFIAATYCRGVPLIVIPTSLMGMVDAAIGGKNGINVGLVKNVIGTIYQPKYVCIDTSFLKTLPLKELQNGIVEMIKHGLICNSEYFKFLENNAEAILKLDSSVIKEAVSGSYLIKQKIVQEDQNEGGKRRLLNFGHTIGHALETLSQFRISHGEAVSLGILGESLLACKMGVLDEVSFDKIIKIFRKYKINPFDALKNPINTKELIQAMGNDKKSLKNNPRFVILNGIGSALPCDGQYCMATSHIFLQETWEQLSFYDSR